MNVTFFGFFANVSKDLKMRSSRIRPSPKHNNKCLYKRRNEEKVCRGEDHIKTGTETGVIWMSAKECKGQPSTTRNWEGVVEQIFHSEPQKEAALLTPTSDFWPSRPAGLEFSVDLSLPVESFVRVAQGNKKWNITL